MTHTANENYIHNHEHTVLVKQEWTYLLEKEHLTSTTHKLLLHCYLLEFPPATIPLTSVLTELVTESYTHQSSLLSTTYNFRIHGLKFLDYPRARTDFQHEASF